MLEERYEYWLIRYDRPGEWPLWRSAGPSYVAQRDAAVRFYTRDTAKRLAKRGDVLVHVRGVRRRKAKGGA
jgi:hypothetical protein